MEPYSEDYSGCRICPRDCGADRNAGPFGFCRSAGTPRVAHAGPHYWEEPPISGIKGSGTVFFSGCNLRCAFCQNRSISKEEIGKKADAEELAEMFVLLGEECHNINLVTAGHHVPVVASAIEKARDRGLRVPVVYNTGSYEKVSAIKRLEGLIDIYLPDLKYVSVPLSRDLSGAPDYFEVASSAILEMLSQVGHLEIGDDGVAQRGLLVRHLILPGETADSCDALKWIRANLGTFTHVSIMSQYTPDFLTDGPMRYARRITDEEYSEVVMKASSIGLINVFTQETSSADKSFVPKFNRL